MLKSHKKNWTCSKEVLNLDASAKEKRQSQIKLLFLMVFILGAAMVLYFTMPSEAEDKSSQSEPAKEVFIDHEKENNLKSDRLINEHDIEDAEKEKIQRVSKKFITEYYSYDHKKNDNLAKAKNYLTPEFYAELKNGEEKVGFAYRVIDDISFRNFEVNNGIPRLQVYVETSQLNEKKQIVRTVDVQFDLDLKRQKNDWKVSYFSVIGKGIKEHE